MALPVGVTKLGSFKGGKGDTGVLASLDVELLPWDAEPYAEMIGPDAYRGARLHIPMPLPGPETVNNDDATELLVKNPTKTRSALTETIATELGGPGTLPGNRIAVLGDSTARGTYNGDSQPGVDGANILIPGMSWLTWAAQLSGGRLIRHRNAAVIGNTLAQMNARVQADVIAFRPDACVVVSGYNDAQAGVTTAAYEATFREIHRKLHDAGIEMIAATPLPTNNGGQPFSDILNGYSAFIRAYAADHGLQLIDFNAAMKAADGAMIPEVKTDGDGVHPGAAGQVYLGRYVAGLLTPRLPRAASLPARRTLRDFGNITPNRLFAGAPVSGLAPSVFRVGAADAAVTPSVTTAPFVEGNMQRITHAGSTSPIRYAQRVQKANQWNVGDLLAITGIVTTSGIRADVEVEFTVPPYGNCATRITKDATKATFYAEIRIPQGLAGSYIDVNMYTGPGTGYAEFGELSIYNLTALGMD